MCLKTISLTINPTKVREIYLSRLVYSFLQNDYKDYKLFVNFEPSYRDYPDTFNKMFDMINNIDIDKDILVNKEKLGLNKNIFNCINRAFESGSEYNVHLEDDLILAPDAFNLLNWYFDEFTKDRDKYFAYTLYSSDNLVEKESIIRELQYFLGWGWSCFSNQWENVFIEHWNDINLANKVLKKENNFNYSWDMCILAHCLDAKLVSICPLLSRSKHCGMVGVHTSLELYLEFFDKIKVNKKSYKDLSNKYILTL